MLINTHFTCFLYFIVQYIMFTPLLILISNSSIKISKCVLFALISSGISTLFTIILPNSNIELLSIFNTLLIFITSTLIFKTAKIFALTFNMLCALILYTTNIFCLSFNILTTSNHYVFYHLIILTFVTFIVYNFLQKRNKLNITDYFKGIPEIYILLFTLILSFDFTACLSLELAYTSLFIQSLLAISIIKLIKNIYDINILKLSYSNMSFEYLKLKSVIDDIRMFKHDYNNTLCSIGGYISLNDMDGLKGFYNKLTLDLNKTNNTQMINPKNINEPSIYNLLMSKYNNIIQKGLKFEFYSAINYKNIGISPYDFSKILGIFLDNAIDAAKDSNEKYISLNCEMLKDSKYQITIKNSYLNKNVDIEKIFLKGYSSKEIKSGLGLWEVSKIINTMPNVSLQTKKDEKYFIQELTIASK